MQKIHAGVRVDTDAFDYARGLLTRYPELSPSEVHDLKRWFLKEASAMDVASMASIEGINAQYAAFRSEHVDRLGLPDYIIILVVIAALLGAVLFFTT